VTPIPKHSTKPPAYRPIALSSAFCKLTEFILKNRLDWYLEHNSLIPSNLFGFRRGLGTMDCLSSLIGSKYQAFYDQSFLSAAFIDVQGAYDSVHIPTLISRLHDLKIPIFFFARTYPPYFMHVIYHSPLL